MKLSIITINYNNAQGLRKTIESVTKQTFSDFEYIVIDGGSDDESLNIIKEYRNRITYWISEPDSGIYNAMNKGIKVANGEYIQFLNSGDWLTHNQVIEKLHGELINCDLLYGNLIEVYPNGKTIVNYGTKGLDISFYTFYKGTVTHPAAFIRRELFLKYGYYDEQLKIVSDWKFYLIALGLNHSKVIYKNIEVCYFDMSGISNNRQDQALNERQKVLNELVPFPVLHYFKLNENELKRLEFIKRFNMTIWLNSVMQFPLVIFSKLLDKIGNIRNIFRN
jgi:glycosyltransferase involved in cell wall biosynthesis